MGIQQLCKAWRAGLFFLLPAVLAPFPIVYGTKVNLSKTLATNPQHMNLHAFCLLLQLIVFAASGCGVRPNTKHPSLHHNAAAASADCLGSSLFISFARGSHSVTSGFLDDERELLHCFPVRNLTSRATLRVIQLKV